MLGGSKGEDKDEVRENVHAYFPVVKWIWSGVAVLIIFAGTLIFNMYTDSIELRKELEAEQKMNRQQNKRIEETYRLMRSIATDQARIAQTMQNLSENFTIAMQRVTTDTNDIRRRFDNHIDESD